MSQKTAERAELPSSQHFRPLAVAVVVVAIEAFALAASALGLMLYQLLGHRPHDPLDAWLVVVFAALVAAGLGYASVGLRRRRRWARSPAVLAQLLTIPVGVNAFGDGAWWIGVPLLVCGALGLVGLFAPSSTQALVGAAYSSTSKPSRK